DHIAQRFRHRPPLGIESPAVRGAGAVRRAAVNTHSNQQRAMEPAAVLVASFQIEIGRPWQIGAAPEHGEVAGAGIEPHIENVGLFAKQRSAALAAPGSGGNQLACLALVPYIGRMLAEKVYDAVENGPVGEWSLAALAVEDDDRHAPHALPRDAPIRPGSDHIRNALLAPGGQPRNALDLLESAAAKLVALHSDEPLVGSAEDGRIMAAPAVGIAVLDGLARE